MSDWDYDIRLRIRSRSKEERAFFGPGVAELMELIKKEGQMTQACRSMGMAYSKGWRILKHASEGFGVPLVKGSSGGEKGGHMVLTSEGEALLMRYRRMEEELKQTADEIFNRYFS